MKISRRPLGPPACPLCAARLERVDRRFVDRLVSLVLPLHRYHCQNFSCGWSGNLSSAAAAHAARGGRRAVLDAARPGRRGT